jgi:hypothetical protein
MNLKYVDEDGLWKQPTQSDFIPPRVEDVFDVISNQRFMHGHNLNHVVPMELQFHEWACVDEWLGVQICKWWYLGPLDPMSFTTMVFTIGSIGLTEGPTCVFGVSINVS